MIITMKNLKDYINEKKYDYHCVIPPFNMEVIKRALRAYKDNDDRKKNEGNGRPTKDQIEDTLKLLDKNSRVEV